MERSSRQNRIRSGQAGFTLVELLVVITIIGMLAGLMSVAIPKAMEAGKKAKVKGELTAIVAAVKAYKQEYGFYPLPPSRRFASSLGEEDKNAWVGKGTYDGNESDMFKVIQILSGENVNWEQDMNPKQVRFLEGAKVGNSTIESLPDPWKHSYCLKFDTNDSGGVGYYSTGENIRVGVIGICLGKNGIQDTPDDATCDDIFSWR